MLMLFSILAVINSVYYTFYKSFVSVSLIKSIKMVKDVESSVFDKLQIVDLLFIVFPILFVLINNYLKRKNLFILNNIFGNSKKSFIIIINVSLKIGLTLNIAPTVAILNK